MKTMRYNKSLLDIDDLQRITGFSHYQINRRVESGELPAPVINGRWSPDELSKVLKINITRPEISA